MNARLDQRLSWLVIAALPLLAGSTCQSSCGTVLPFSEKSDAKGELTVDVSGGPADGSLRINIGGTFFTGSPVDSTKQPTTYKFTGLPSGTV